MDRVHRIGQTKTVNVFRIICEDTIDERAQQLQGVKMRVAESIISNENSAPSFDSVLDYTNLHADKSADDGSLPNESQKSEFVDLHSEYKEHFNVDSFFEGLKTIKR
ncbi:TATA-binding protein-associated factor 172 [Thelohanellus kitauei]|uniref:TATA-binding protein-associated factor 172 n=1 Tax=Thelohanellus kitauei TaxID=669202 RepID=A0A0C2MR16_THEKT|nr:TATA-binding protein-associated factor 172 [Thelohanellus kitauei]